VATTTHDLILRGGLVVDGSGGAPFEGDVAIDGDRIVAVGHLGVARGREEIDVRGLAVAPGFINMLSWATESLIDDGRSLSDLVQGVTLEVFGEGWSMGPLSEPMATEMRERQSDVRYDVSWRTLGEYLAHLEARGVAPNVASFVGATTVRIHVLGEVDRPPTAYEQVQMEALVDAAMREGAMGVGASLIYAPACYARTEELIGLAAVAGRYDGLYIAHLRSEGASFLEALDEHLRIAREGNVRAEVYHLKAAGRSYWHKLDEAIARIEGARAAGLRITADMYTYEAGSTGLDAAMPPWVQEGGHRAWVARLRDPAIRTRVVAEMEAPAAGWENLFYETGAEGMLLGSFQTARLQPLAGRTLADVARERGTSPAETAIDLVIEDDTRVGTIYFMMDQANVRRQMALPWVSFGSDSPSVAPDGNYRTKHLHPRAYGTFARVLGKYVRDDAVITLPEAVRRLTALPASNLRLRDRGRLAVGMMADVVVFDPTTVTDHATYVRPHALATGVHHVVVNGRFALRDGVPTGALPGRVVRGPGWAGHWNQVDG
jgi:N-acyl-D-amino-acid deacylase